MGATPIDDNDADGKSGKLYGWLLIIRCTRLVLRAMLGGMLVSILSAMICGIVALF